MRKTVIYIDGQNLHYNLHALGLQEKDIDWAAVFADLTPNGHILIRANWYQAAKISSWSWSPYHERHCPSGMTLEAFRESAEKYYRTECDRLDWMHRNIYGRLEEDFDSIEFRYGGVLKIAPTTTRVDGSGVVRVGARVGEKGVDVALAVDMVRQAHAYDHAVLISGDFDYVPAIQAVKDMLRRVTVVSVMKGTPPHHQGHARRLRGLCDDEVHLYETDLQGKYKR